MDLSALVSTALPAVVIDEPVWAQLVSYPLAPECENERLQRLIYHGLQALSSANARVCDVTFGYFCLPPDGNPTTPLWQALRLLRQPGQVVISLDR